MVRDALHFAIMKVAGIVAGGLTEDGQMIDTAFVRELCRICQAAVRPGAGAFALHTSQLCTRRQLHSI